MIPQPNDPTVIVHGLCASFTTQIGLYKALHDRTQKILSKLILSRGEVSSLKAAFDEKKALLKEISDEREKIDSSIFWWQEHKGSLETFAPAKQLDALLVTMERAIKTFLESEDQLERHLAKLVKSSTPT